MIIVRLAVDTSAAHSMIDRLAALSGIASATPAHVEELLATADDGLFKVRSVVTPTGPGEASVTLFIEPAHDLQVLMAEWGQ